MQGEGHGRRGGGELICFDVPSAVLHCSAPPTGPPHHQHCVYTPLLADHPRPLRPARQPRWSTISAKTNLKYHSDLSESDRYELFLKICRCRPETFSQFKETWERGPCRHRCLHRNSGNHCSRHRCLHRNSGNHCSRHHPFTCAGIGACNETVEFIEAGTSTPFGVYNIKKGEGWGGVPGALPRAPSAKLALYARLCLKLGGHVTVAGNLACQPQANPVLHPRCCGGARPASLSKAGSPRLTVPSGAECERRPKTWEAASVNQ